MNVSVEDVSAFVLGGHGDTMVPMPRFSTVAGIPLPELVKMGWIKQDRLDQIVTAHPRWRRRDRRPAQDRLGLLCAGHLPPSRWPKSYLKDQKRVLPCAVHVDGAYGIKDIYVGVPVVIGEKGVERIVELDLTDAEKAGVEQVRRRGERPDRGLQETGTKIGLNRLPRLPIYLEGSRLACLLYGNRKFATN